MSEGVRINKYLAEAGICSRREADRLVEARKVLINGNTAENGSKVFEDDEVSVNGKKISGAQKKVYLAFYKPAGIVCTAEKQEENNNGSQRYFHNLWSKSNQGGVYTTG